MDFSFGLMFNMPIFSKSFWPIAEIVLHTADGKAQVFPEAEPGYQYSYNTFQMYTVKLKLSQVVAH